MHLNSRGFKNKIQNGSGIEFHAFYRQLESTVMKWIGNHTCTLNWIAIEKSLTWGRDSIIGICMLYNGKTRLSVCSYNIMQPHINSIPFCVWLISYNGTWGLPYWTIWGSSNYPQALTIYNGLLHAAAALWIYHAGSTGLYSQLQ